MKALWPLLSVFFIPSVSALEVLGVVGSVVPAKPYYEKLLAKRPTGNSAQLRAKDIQRATRWSGDYGHESGLTPGSFEPFMLTPEITKRLTQPLCLVANDQVSKDWLTKSRSVLTELNAICYLVKSTGSGELESLRGHASNVRFFALNPTLIITQFNVPHYPALISKRGVEQ